VSYTRVTSEERRLIYDWKQDGKSCSEIAQLLKRNKSTISRELRRNKGGRGYRYQQAHRKAQDRARRPGSRWFGGQANAPFLPLSGQWVGGKCLFYIRFRWGGRMFVFRRACGGRVGLGGSGCRR